MEQVNTFFIKGGCQNVAVCKFYNCSRFQFVSFIAIRHYYADSKKQKNYGRRRTPEEDDKDITKCVFSNCGREYYYSQIYNHSSDCNSFNNISNGKKTEKLKTTKTFEIQKEKLGSN